MNLPPPRGPEESTENYNDPVKYLYDLLKDIAVKIDERYLKKEGTSKFKGRLHMSQHRISNIANSVEYDDVATRVQALTDTISEMQSVRKIVETHNKILGIIVNQILLFKCAFAAAE